MADVTPRKSGRGRIPNKKYEDGGLEVLKELLDSDSEQNDQIAFSEGSSLDDDEFRADTIISVPSDEDDSISGATSQSSGVRTPVEDFDDIEDAISEQGESVEPSRFKGPSLPKYPKNWTKKETKPATHSRGIPENPLSGYSKISRLIPFAGPAEEDQQIVLKSMQHWVDEATLPRRSRFRHPFSHTEEQRDLEATKGWDWFNDHGGKTIFADRQRLQPIETRECVKYLPSSTQPRATVLLGPYGRQEPFSLPEYRSLSVDEAWKDAIAKSDEQGTRPTERQKNAWILNVGGRVRCFDWATNQDGERQYLAIATKRPVSKEQAKAGPIFNTPRSGPSAIQIWCFHSHLGLEGDLSSLDGDRRPDPRQILCTDWGDPKQLKWCPMPRKFRDGQDDQDQLGLLAAVFDDGIVRILDVNVGKSPSEEQKYLKFNQAAISLRPFKGSIATSICWLSQTDIAVGHSSGFLAVFSIDPRKHEADLRFETVSSPARLESSPSDIATNANPNTTPPLPYKPRPWLIHRLHQSYITSLTTAYPSFPHFLASTSIDGKPRLSSFPNLHACHVSARRSNTQPSCAVYHHSLHGFIIPDDAREIVAFTGMRAWGSNIGIAEAGSGGVTGVDVGKAHASLAFGCTDGKVVVTNPIRRVIKGNEKVWQLTVFRQEWAKLPSAAEGDQLSTEEDVEAEVVDGGGSEGEGEGEGGGRGIGDGAAIGAGAGAGAGAGDGGKRIGTSRITESYKIKKADIDTNAAKRSIITGTRGSGRGGTMTTIFEEETVVTAVSWNPNLHCGGWLAVGWGSGLVRVEDVAI